ELGLFIADAVAADDCASGFHHLGKAAGQDALEYPNLGLFREADEGECRERLSPHGVNVAERVRRGDLAEGKGIVDDWRKEIDGLDQSLVGSYLIHARVVGVVEADQNIGVMLPG